MSKRLLIVMLFALVVSGGASFLLYRVLGNRMVNQIKQPTTTVVVAAKQLEIGTLLKDGDITTAEWPGTVPEGALTKREEIIGRGVVSTIYAGEPVRNTRLAAMGAGGGMAATIPVGMRAVAIRVNDIVGVSGFVTPGQRVDLLIMGLPPAGQSSGNTGTVSKTLLQNIEVLSAGSQIQKDAEGKPIPVPVVNLLVTPEQAEVVSLASNHAQIQLILRNPLDKDDSKTKGAAYTRLFSENPMGAGLGATPLNPVRARANQPPAPPKPAVEKKAPELPPVVVEILHGGTKAQVTFKRTTEVQ